MDHIPHTAAAPLISELLAAITDLGGLDRLDHHRLAAILDATRTWPPGYLTTLQAATTAAHDRNRPATVADLHALDGHSEIAWFDDETTREAA